MALQAVIYNMRCLYGGMHDCIEYEVPSSLIARGAVAKAADWLQRLDCISNFLRRVQNAP